MVDKSESGCQISVRALSDELGIAFGTSGIRALAENLTQEICFAFTTAFLSEVCSTARTVAIGIDRRPSSPDIAKACIAAAKARGLSVCYSGVLPTPALAYYAMQINIPAVMITGSHIPFDRNGIKFYRSDGEISKSDETAIMNAALRLPDDLDDDIVDLPDVDASALHAFWSRYDRFFPEGMLCGKRIGVYEHSSVARDWIKSLLSHYGAEVISLDRTEIFVPIDTEAVSLEDVKKGLRWAEQYRLDAIVSTDGDGDRPLIANEKGEWLRGDMLGVLCANYLNATHVAAPVNVNTLLEHEGLKCSPSRVHVRTKIGSPYVIEGMNQLAESDTDAKVVGYEANGGFLVGSDIQLNSKVLKALPTRDSILPILIVCAMSYETNKPIGRLAERFDNRFTASDRVKDVASITSHQLIELLKRDSALQESLFDVIAENGELLSLKSIDETDGLRFTLDNQDVVHFRASGNAPELRCYVETGGSFDRAKRVVEKVVSMVLGVIDYEFRQ